MVICSLLFYSNVSLLSTPVLGQHVDYLTCVSYSCFYIGVRRDSCQTRCFPSGIMVYNIFREKMPSIKYLCNHCQELFEFLDSHRGEDIKCPRCASKDIKGLTACSLETGPPPWEYLCQQCSGRFRVKVPGGPSEEKEIRCPRCESRNVKWLTIVSEACPPGG